METLELTFYCIGTVSLFAAGLFKLYAIGYQHGFDEAKRCGVCGFTLKLREPLLKLQSIREVVGV